MLRRNTAIGCLGIFAIVFSSPQCIANAVGQNASTSDDPCLAFALPNADFLFSSPKKVFAHYFYPFPLSINNKSASDDYYNANYLNIKGESGKWAASGSYLRQRPLPVGINSDRNWPLNNMQREVRLAIARGITGFTFDVLSAKEAASSDDTHLQMLLSAAHTVDPRFKILVMPDISALKSDSATVVNSIAVAASSPAAYRLPHGPLVVSAFNAGANSADWWASVIAQLKARGIAIAFVPTFLGWKGQAPAFAPIRHDFAGWGTAAPTASL